MSQKDFPCCRVTPADRTAVKQLGSLLFDCPELGFFEEKTKAAAVDFLKKAGIEPETGFAVTGIKATIGAKTGYHIALVADMDALAASTPAGPVPIHSCGHNIQVAVLLYALKLLKESGLAEKAGCRVSFIGTPAEEFIDFAHRDTLRAAGRIHSYSGKQNMIREGVFDDVDCAISIHINGERDTLFDVDSTLTGFVVKKAVFHGVAAHSGAAPQEGRSALDGANLCMTALSFLKERFAHADGLQLHPVLTSCSGGVNIVPDEAVLETYIRAADKDALKRAEQLFDACVPGCAAALGLTAQVFTTPGYLPLRQSADLNRVVLRNLEKLCPPEAVLHHVPSGASGDVGDLASLLPTVQVGFSGMTGRIHSAQFAVTDEENAYCRTLQLVADTVCDLLANPADRPVRENYAAKKQEYLENWLHEKQPSE